MFLDIGVGIIAAIFVSGMFDVPLSVWMVMGGILFALLPDVDFLYYFTKRGDSKYDYKHREIVHCPLVSVPIGTFLVWIIGGKVWAVLFFISFFLHLVHDSIAVGWGIKWLYPFSRNNFAFFYLYSLKNKKGLRKLLFSFNERELPGVVAEHGDGDWVRNIYYKWHPIAIVEFSVFMISLMMLYFYVR